MAQGDAINPIGTSTKIMPPNQDKTFRTEGNQRFEFTGASMGGAKCIEFGFGIHCPGVDSPATGGIGAGVVASTGAGVGVSTTAGIGFADDARVGFVWAETGFGFPGAATRFVVADA